MSQQSWPSRDVGDGIPVLWIHGYPLSSAIYAPQESIPGARHIVPDLPGFGSAPPPEGEMTIDGYAEGILRIMDEKGIRSAVVAGLSMGGYIALSVARQAMERLCGLILIDTRETPDAPEARAKRFESIEAVRAAGTGSVVEAMLPKMLTEATMKQDTEKAGAVRRIMESASKDGVIAALGAMARRGDSSALLPRIEVPTLVVAGREDAITPPSDAERMRSAIPGAELLILENAAHLSNFERPAEFNRAVSRFLQKVGPGR
ncbi:MAG TPA: alpha/beta fold hydrolase [Thermoanaerobaculia bacterium]|nr:alpha/beta fold hydrolase [Thermoanaerobaculia bacterium]